MTGILFRVIRGKYKFRNTGEVGFEPTTGILEIPILPIKLHSYLFLESTDREPGLYFHNHRILFNK